MKAEASADDARRRRDEKVRRLREESRRRVEGERRRRAFSSWCALVTLGAGIWLAALGARDARLLKQAAQDAAAARAAVGE